MRCDVPLQLRPQESIMQSGLVSSGAFDFAAELLVDTNMFAVKCSVTVPIHVACHV